MTLNGDSTFEVKNIEKFYLAVSAASGKQVPIIVETNVIDLVIMVFI